MLGKWPSGKKEEELIQLRESGATIQDVAKKVGVSNETARLHICPIPFLISDSAIL